MVVVVEVVMVNIRLANTKSNHLTSRTPLDLAGLYNHMDIVKYLDAMAASETVKDKKAVNKSKQKSYERAVDSVKRFRRMQADTTKKLEKEQEKLLQRSNGDASSTQAVEGAAGSGGGGGGVKSRFGTVTSLNLFSDSKSFLGRSIRGFPVGKKHATFSSSSAAGCPKSFSDISGIQATVRRERKADSKGASSSDAKNGLLDANSKKIKWKGSLDLAVSGSSDSGSISATPTTPPRRGLVRDFQVMYVDKSASSKVILIEDYQDMKSGKSGKSFSCNIPFKKYNIILILVYRKDT